MESAQMKQWLLIILAMGALIIGYRQLNYGEILRLVCYS
jgi:hypothetical protein